MYGNFGNCVGMIVLILTVFLGDSAPDGVKYMGAEGFVMQPDSTQILKAFRLLPSKRVGNIKTT